MTVMSLFTPLLLASFCAHPAVAQVAVTEETQLLASDGDSGDEFGFSVAISGDTAVVGSPFSDDAGERSGAAYVYVYDGDWGFQTKLTLDTARPFDEFGVSADIDEDTIVVGASGRNDFGVTGHQAGAAFVFTRSGTLWTLEAELLAEGEVFPQGDRFGTSVSISGNTIAVGAPGYDHATTDGGAAYLFVRSGSMWSQQALFRDFSSLSYLGSSASLDGDLAVFGAPQFGTQGSTGNGGLAYVFARKSTVWTQEAVLYANPGLGVDAFGNSVSISGHTALIGAPADDTNGTGAGAAYLFSRQGTAWSTATALTADQANAGNALGRAVCLSDSIAIVGGALQPAHRYRLISSDWQHELTLDAVGVVASDRFGAAVAVEGEMVVVGAPQDDPLGVDSGSAFAFRVQEVFPPFCNGLDQSTDSCPCSNPGSPDAGCDIPQGTGGVRLDVLAQDTLPANRVTFEGVGYPTMGTPTALGIRATHVDPLSPVVFGDGLRCVGVPLVRLDASFAFNGSSIHIYAHSPMAGSGTFYYQLWFRSTPDSSCTPDAFNLSSGRTLVW